MIFLDWSFGMRVESGIFGLEAGGRLFYLVCAD